MLITRVRGRVLLRPMVIVIAAIGMAIVIFALDSVPAIFGLTHIDDIGSVQLPHIGIAVSLGFILATLPVATIVSLLKSGYDRRRQES